LEIVIDAGELVALKQLARVAAIGKYRTVVAHLFVKQPATCNPSPPVTTLTRPGTQYGGTKGKAETIRPSRMAVIANPYKPRNTP
jgi:hypothetical protein